MKIREILRNKGYEVVTIGEEDSVLDAAKALAHHNIGSLLVTRGRRPAGIITERDILLLTAAEAGPLQSIRVGSVMTRDLVVAGPEDGLREMMGVMTERRIRHLPVIEDERLVGIVSIGDLVNACRNIAEEENTQLREYIYSRG